MANLNIELTREFMQSVLREYLDRSVGGSAILGMVADALTRKADKRVGTERDEEAEHLAEHAIRVRRLADELRARSDEFYSTENCAKRDATRSCVNCDGDGRTEAGGCPRCGKVGRTQDDCNA